MSKLGRIDHVAISVADIKRSIKWYMTSFECRLVSETPREAVLEFENIRLVLVLPSQEPAHLAVLKEDAHTYGELRERSFGLWTTFVADPTGNVVELVGSGPKESERP